MPGPPGPRRSSWAAGRLAPRQISHLARWGPELLSRRPFQFVGVTLLFVAAFGGLSVGIPLVLATLLNRATVDSGLPGIVVPSLFLAYGVVSLGGAIGWLVGWRGATLLGLASQGIVAVGLLWVFFRVAGEVSLLIVAGIAGGAVLCAVVDRATVRPG